MWPRFDDVGLRARAASATRARGDDGGRGTPRDGPRGRMPEPYNDAAAVYALGLVLWEVAR